MNGSSITRRAATMLVAVFAISASARAGLIVTMGDAFIQAGGNSYVDLHVASSSGTLPLANYIFELEITGPGGPGLEFSVPQLDSHLMESDYVFDNDSFAFNSSSGTSAASPYSYVGIDLTDSGLDVQLATSPRLLGRVDLSGLNVLDSMIGQSFAITFRADQSMFFDAGFSQLAFDPSSKFVGTVMVTQAVPEPSSLLLCAAAIGFAGVLRRRKPLPS